MREHPDLGLLALRSARGRVALLLAATFGWLCPGDAARADSIQWEVVSGNPAAMTPGSPLVVDLRYDITTQGLTSAVTLVEIIGGVDPTGQHGSFAITGAQTTGRNAQDSFRIITGFGLAYAGLFGFGSCTSAGAWNTRTCHDSPRWSGAGPFGGLSIVGLQVGNYVVGTLTIEAVGSGAGTLTTRIVRGGAEWQARFNDLDPQPRDAVLALIANPEPATAALLGLGVAALAGVTRRSRAWRGRLG